METYTLVLNSTNARGRTGTGTTGYTFEVNWRSLIPKELELRKFNLTWSWRSAMSISVPATSIVFVNMGASPACLDQLGGNQILGTIQPHGFNGPSSVLVYYESNADDDTPITCRYPMNSTVAVSVLNINGSVVTNFPDYVLSLIFTPIDE